MTPTAMIPKTKAEEIDQENLNFARITKIILNVFAGALRYILKTYVPPSSLPAVPNGARLNNNQKEIIKRVHTRKSYEECDVSLLYALLRFIISRDAPRDAPTEGWGKTVDDVNVKLGDDLERIRILRNDVFGHLPSSQLTDVIFNDLKQNFKGILGRIDNVHKFGQYATQRTNYMNAMDEILRAPMDPTSFISTLKELEQRMQILEADHKVILQKAAVKMNKLKLTLRILALVNVDEEVSGYTIIKNVDIRHCLGKPLEYRKVKAGTDFSEAICESVSRCISSVVGSTDTSVDIIHTETVIRTEKDIDDTLMLKLKYHGCSAVPDCYSKINSAESKRLISTIEDTVRRSLRNTFDFPTDAEVVAMYKGSLIFMIVVYKCSGLPWCAEEADLITCPVKNALKSIVVTDCVFGSLTVVAPDFSGVSAVTMEFVADVSEICPLECSPDEFIGKFCDTMGNFNVGVDDGLMEKNITKAGKGSVLDTSMEPAIEEPVRKPTPEDPAAARVYQNIFGPSPCRIKSKSLKMRKEDVPRVNMDYSVERRRKSTLLQSPILFRGSNAKAKKLTKTRNLFRRSWSVPILHFDCYG